MPKLGDKVDVNQITKSAPPVVLAVQPDGFIKVSTPEELRLWEEDVSKFLGINIKSSGLVGTASESCSAGCSDDCDVC